MIRALKPTFCSIQMSSTGENQKGTAGRGRGKKCHDNLRQAGRRHRWGASSLGSHLQNITTPGGSPTEEMCDTLQDALLDTVRQLMGQPAFTADQLHLARLPVTAGGLGLPHLPTLALIARAACIALCPGQHILILSD